MASIQGPNPLDRLAAYFKPCTGQFSQQDCYNMEDTLAELRERQQENPLNNLDAFFRPLTKKYEKADYYNDEIWAPHNPFAEKIEIRDSVKIAKIKSSTSNQFSTKTSTKRRKVDSFDDENKLLPSLSTTTTSSDASSSESSDNDEDSNDNETFPSPEHRKVSISQGGDDASEKKQIDENIIENLETLHLISDNSKTTTALRKIAKPKSKKQLAITDEVPKMLTTEKKDEKFPSTECKEKDEEILWTIEGGKNDLKTIKKYDEPETPRAGFIGNRAHKYLDILDNQDFKARHQKIITRRFHETNLSSGLSSLLSDGFKPAQYDL